MRTILSSLALAAGMTAAAVTPLELPVIPADPALEAKVQKTLSSLTLEQKVGQMLQLQVDVVGDVSAPDSFTLNPAKLDSVVSRFRPGSFLNTPATCSLTAAEWDKLISAIQSSSMRLNDGIPMIYGLDQIHGTTYVQDGMLFPQGINLGATFDPELTRRGAEITAYLTRAADCPWTFSPTVDLARDPRWSRFWENYGEDPLVNAVMGAAAVRGFQGDNPNHIDRNHIASCLKHYMAYGSPFSGKDRTPAWIAPSELRDKYFGPFLHGIKNGALSVMVNSSSINGEPVHASWTYLTQWLKNDLAWDGLIVTDWADINNLYTREHVATDKKDAIRIAINAGIDMSMDPYSGDFCTLLMELVREGKVSQERIDDAVARILRLKYRLGLFDTPDTNLKEYPDFGSEEFAKESLKAAVRSMVLLKNDSSVLPLAEGTRILVTGPAATTMRALNGGWSYSWQGHTTDRYAADKYNNIVEALGNRFGKTNVTYVPTVTYDDKGAWYDETDHGTDAAVEAAKHADAIVMCIGENSYCETPGNLTDLYLSEKQRNAVKALAATGRPVILVLVEGRPRILADIEPLAYSVIDAMLPGNMGGDALAALIAGDENFSGKLPFTYPREINSLTTYDYKASEEAPKMEGAYDYDARVNVQWPFGYGKSYTTFEYSDLSVDHKEFGPDDVITLKIDVTNTGSRDGIEAVLAYSSDRVASLVPDNKRLRGFTTLALMPGETRAAEFRIPACDLAFVGADGRWVLEPGDFTLSVGGKSVTVRCTEGKTWTTPNI